MLNRAPVIDRYLVPAVVSAGRVLDALAAPERPAATQVELGRALELSKSTMHNLLATLEHLDLVMRDQGSREYRLGPALVRLGRAAQREMDVAVLAAHRIVELASETGLSLAVARVAEPGRAVVIDRAYPSGSVFVGIALGGEFRSFDGATGKCLLAAMEPADAARLVRTAAIPSRTPSTLKDPDAILREIDVVREQGWASVVKEFNDNHAVAVPLYGPTGDFDLVLFALGFPGQLPEADIGEVGALLRGSADAISAACGGDGDAPSGEATDRDITTTNGPSRAKETSTI